MKLLGVLVLLALLVVPSASALPEVWVYGGAGVSDTSVNTKPNLWKQTDFPYDYTGTTPGWRAGLGAGLSNGLFLELGAVSLGAPSIRSTFVPDDHLTPGTGHCYKDCGPEHQRQLALRNNYLGGELVVGYQIAWILRPYIKGGAAGFAHEHSGHVQNQSRVWHFDGNDQPSTEKLAGVMLAAVLGGGICGDVYRGILVCGDVEKFFPVAHTANPLIDSGLGGPVLTTFQVRIPLL